MRGGQGRPWVNAPAILHLSLGEDTQSQGLETPQVRPLPSGGAQSQAESPRLEEAECSSSADAFTSFKHTDVLLAFEEQIC